MIRFDVVALGGGPGGERAAIQAARAGKGVALVERENVIGGMRVNWGTIPSKTLRESALFVHGLRHNKLDAIKVAIADTITIPELMYREQRVVQRELELINRSLNRYAIEIYRGEGRFLDAHTVAVHGVDGQVRLKVAGDVIVIATGSSPNRPGDIDFDDDTVFDSTTVLRLPRMPRSMIVLGAGVIGVEYASIFAALGLAVTLVDTRADLLPFIDREIAGLLRRELGRLGVVFVANDHYARVGRIEGAPPRMPCEKHPLLGSPRELAVDRTRVRASVKEGTMEHGELKPILDSIIFVSPSPVKLETLVEILPESNQEVILEQLQRIKEEYEDPSRGVELAEVAGGYQFRTKPMWAEWVARLKKAKTVKFSQSALETLAIIAYRQPVIRPQIEEIRGVDCGWVLRSLMEKGLVKILGRKDLPGRHPTLSRSRGRGGPCGDVPPYLSLSPQRGERAGVRGPLPMNSSFRELHR